MFDLLRVLTGYAAILVGSDTVRDQFNLCYGSLTSDLHDALKYNVLLPERESVNG